MQHRTSIVKIAATLQSLFRERHALANRIQAEAGIRWEFDPRDMATLRRLDDRIYRRYEGRTAFVVGWIGRSAHAEEVVA
jgi:hypothetical protein